MIDSLAAYMDTEKTILVISESRDQRAWKGMVANTERQGI